MVSRLFTVSILALSVVVSATALPAVDETATGIVKRQCQAVCCDLFVKSYDDTIEGVTCTPGGIDCAFSFQQTGCCNIVIPGSTNARGCTVS
ncbi:hypothetical protein V491_06282 [Pseudogymnoascus sp. VKM F-3775]|nr:hypothetical protein V491_06282 [Pseudogymnoascus sp. VKM F-3775]